MGYVFLPRKFEEGRIPTLQGYQNAMYSLRKGLLGLSAQGIIHGANIHGSNFHSDGGVGSDIDVLVVMNSQEAEGHLGRLYSAVRDSTYVPLEFVPTLRHMAERGYHGVDGSYAQYMQMFCRDGVIGKNPFDVILPKPTWENPKQEVLERFEINLTKLSKQRSNLPTEYNEEHCDFLEKLMRQPIYSAIDMLRLKYGSYPSRDGKPLSKAECCQLYAKEFPELTISDLFLVLGIRNRYRQLLQEHESKDLQTYIQLLDEIDHIYPNARRVMERNFELLLASQSLSAGLFNL